MRPFATRPRSRHVLAIVLLLSLLGPAAVLPQQITAAQEGSPEAGAPMADPFAGVTLEPLGSIAPSVAADHGLSFIRITMEPGAIIPAHQHPGAVVLFIEEGTFGSTFSGGEGEITRVGQPGTPGPVETVAAGDALTMQPGDVLTYEGAVHTMENPGDEPLVLLATVLLAADQPAFIFAMDMGTPTP